jgi:hypothetical protein
MAAKPKNAMNLARLSGPPSSHVADWWMFEQKIDQPGLRGLLRRTAACASDPKKGSHRFYSDIFKSISWHKAYAEGKIRRGTELRWLHASDTSCLLAT